jgi:hypothetical protein
LIRGEGGSDGGHLVRVSQCDKGRLKFPLNGQLSNGSRQPWPTTTTLAHNNNPDNPDNNLDNNNLDINLDNNLDNNMDNNPDNNLDNNNLDNNLDNNNPANNRKEKQDRREAARRFSFILQ